MEQIEEMYHKLGISPAVCHYAHRVLDGLNSRFEEIDRLTEYNQMKVIAAMQKNRVSADCFNSSSGYGYDDLGRETLEKVYADTFGAEDALERMLLPLP